MCSDPEVQCSLPQFIIGNEHSIPAHRVAELQSVCPDNVHVWRLPSSWVKGSSCRAMLSLLADALEPFAAKYQAILAFDAYKAHFNIAVWSTWAKRGLWPLCIPAKLTWLLQPLDTHGFAAFKKLVAQLFHDKRLYGADGFDGLKTLVVSVASAVTDLMAKKSWAPSFAGNGLSMKQGKVRKTITTFLDLRRPLVVSSEKPSKAQLQLCFPRNMGVPESALFRPLSQPGEHCVGAAASSSGLPAIVPLPPSAVWPIAFRTRSRTAASRTIL